MTAMDLHPAAVATPRPAPDDEHLPASARRALRIEARAREAPTPMLGPPLPPARCVSPPPRCATAAVAMGDALAVAVLEACGFTRQDFARSRRGGALGRKLLLHVEDLMRAGAAVPRSAPGAPLSEGLIEMSRKG